MDFRSSRLKLALGSMVFIALSFMLLSSMGILGLILVLISILMGMVVVGSYIQNIRPPEHKSNSGNPRPGDPSNHLDEFFEFF